MNSKMSITVASDQERDELFAEILYGDEQWAELIFSAARGEYMLEVFPPRSGASYVFSLSEVEEILREAKDRLRRLGYP